MTVDTVQHAQTIKNNIVNELAGKDIFETHTLTGYVDEEGQIKVIADLRFNNGVHRDGVKNWIKAQVRDHPTVKTWVQSASLTVHRCTHGDAEVQNCGTTDFVREWTK